MGEQKVSGVKIICDFVLLLLVGLPILFLFLFGRSFHRGFYCDDESLRHPYRDSTIPSLYLYIVGSGVNLVAMVTLEYRKYRSKSRMEIAGRMVPQWLWELYMALLVFSFGACCSHLITDSMKYSIGRLRPHFFTLCQPKFDNNKTCETVGPNFHRYITDFTCTGSDLNARKLKEMRLSFPSGHSSFASYTFLYFALYLQARLKWKEYRLLKHFLQYVAMLLALLTGMSRISDYKHHWSDVLTGLSIGAVSAIITSRYVSQLFTSNKKRDDHIPSLELRTNGEQPK